MGLFCKQAPFTLNEPSSKGESGSARHHVHPLPATALLWLYTGQNSRHWFGNLMKEKPSELTALNFIT